MYWRSRNTPVGVATAGQITPHRLFSRPSCETTRKFGTSTIVGGTISVARISRNTVAPPAEVVLRQRERGHRVEQQRDQRRDDGDEHRVAEVADEVELAAELGVVLGREAQLAHRLAAVDVDALVLRLVGWLGATGAIVAIRPMRRTSTISRTLPSGCAHAVHRQPLALGTRGDGLLAVRQQRRRKLEQRSLGLERRQHEPHDRAEHQEQAERQVGLGEPVGPVRRGAAARAGEEGEQAFIPLPRGPCASRAREAQLDQRQHDQRHREHAATPRPPCRTGGSAPGSRSGR